MGQASSQICVVGGGRWGKNHIRTLHEMGVLGGIVEAHDETRSTLSAQYQGVQVFADLKDALGKFDAFTVATPAETHFRIASDILNAGHHVLVEKPICLNANEARQLKKLAESKKRTLMVGHVMLFHPAVQKMRTLIDEGKIGKLQYLYSNRLNLGTVRTEENILWSFAPHDISIFQYLTGRVPTEVISRGGAFVQPHIHDTTMTIMTYPDNIVGHIFVSWLHPFKEHRLVVVGTKGMLSYEDSTADKQLLFYEKGVDVVRGVPVSRDGATESIAYDRGQPLRAELEYFIAQSTAGVVLPELAGPQSAIEVLEILEAASRELAPAKPITTETVAVETEQKNFYVHPSSYVDENVEIGEGTKIWHFSHIQPNSKIGKKCSIGQNVNVANNVKIGNFVKIQNNVAVYEGVELEDYVFCGPSMVFTNVLDPRSKYPQRGASHYHKTLVREGASIGANATIVCGHTVGRHAFIAAGAVVTKNVPDYALMAGVPARRIGWMCECGQRLEEPASSTTCSRCSREFSLDGDILVETGAPLTIEVERSTTAVLPRHEKTSRRQAANE